jgi:hypothetical protein
VANTNQARRIAALNMSGTNPIVMMGLSETTVGNTVTRIQGDLGGITNIVVDTSLAKDMVLLLNTDFIKVCYLDGRTIVDLDGEAAKSDDYVRRRLLGEFSFMIQNGGTAHAKITGLTV